MEYFYTHIIEDKLSKIKSCIKPICFKLSVNKNTTIKEMYKEIRMNKDFELEENEDMTSFISYGVSAKSKMFCEENFTVEECLKNNEDIYIYELLNQKGFNHYNKIIRDDLLMNYDQTELPVTERNNEQKILSSNEINQEQLINDMEYKITINHFYIKSNPEYFLRQYQREPLDLKQEPILLKENSILPLTLYEFIWEKYKIHLNEPHKPDKHLWWRYKKSSLFPKHFPKKPFCYPFTIKIMEIGQQAQYQCPYCGWWRFCTGCVLDPYSNKPIQLKFSNLQTEIVVDWCYSIFKNELMFEQINQFIYYDELNLNEKHTMARKPEKTLQECLSIYTQDKVTDKDNLIFCNKCNKETNYSKHCLLDRIMPPILIIPLKHDNTKLLNTTFIDYPLYNLEISNNKYDLYGLINMSDFSLNEKYSAIIKLENNKWVKFNDENYLEINEEQILSENACVLVYINNQNNCESAEMILNILKRLNQEDMEKYKKLLENEEMISISDRYKVFPKKFFKGETVSTNQGIGIYVDKISNIHSKVSFENNERIIKTDAIKHEMYYEVTQQQIEEIMNKNI